jgi:imidazolonepropionase
MIDAGVEVAVATDQNPGSSPTKNLALMATLATTRFGLTAEESLRAVTLGAARALRRTDVGTLVPGCRARFLQLAHADSRSLVAAFGEPIVRRVVGVPQVA